MYFLVENIMFQYYVYPKSINEQLLHLEVCVM